MQDVIIESSNQSSSLAANVRKVTIKKSRGIFSYMFDWLIKGLLTALLLIMNFLLFAGSGSQKVFADGFMLQPEIMSVVIGLLVFSMLLMLLFSFSSVLQNLLVSLIAAVFCAGVFAPSSPDAALLSAGRADIVFARFGICNQVYPSHSR